MAIGVSLTIRADTGDSNAAYYAELRLPERAA
jgi:hypothetical protein